MKGLLHPWFLLALFTLVVNDHFLKGAGLLPGWLTGKISDCAGLVVAPVLAARLVPLGFRRLRAIAFLAPVVVFVAINLSVSAAATWDGWVGLTGMSWTTVSDPTDLVALLSLPLAIWLVGLQSQSVLAAPRRSVGPAELLVALLSGLACMATSIAGDGYQTRIALTNATQSILTVRVRSLQGEFDCGFLAEYHELLGDDRYGGWREYQLDPLDTITLDAYGINRARECGALQLEVEPLPTLKVVFGDVPLFWPSDADRHREQVIRIEGIGSAVDFSGGSAFEMSELGAERTPRACEAPGGAPLSWATSGFFSSQAHTLSAVQNVDDCLDLSFEDGLSLRLCIPETLFPFGVGDPLLVESGQRLAITDLAATIRLNVYDDGTPNGFGFEADDCDPQPSVCGGLVQQGHLVDARSQVLAPGDTASFATSRTEDATLYLGHAEHVVLTDGLCTGARTSLGPVVSFSITERLP